MCISPNMLDCGTEVACRECWQCRKRRVNDLVGRCIAESRFSQQTYAITLTYAPDAGVNAVTLVYKDVQDFLKRLRKKHKCRYIVTGEYGSGKGRAHWHVILFFKNTVPKVEQNKRVEWKYWPHGFSYFQHPDWKGFEYCLKYVLKDQDSRSASSHLAMSKKPPLGHEYFQALAEEHVRQGLAPQNYFYKFGDVRDGKNRDKSFMMTGKTKVNFMETFRKKWIQNYDFDPRSEIFDEYIDDITLMEYTDEELMKRLHDKAVTYVQPWPQLDQAAMTDEMIEHEIEYDGVPLLIYEYKDEFTIVSENDQWREDRDEIVQMLKKRAQKIRKRSVTEVLREHWDETYH